MDIEFLIDGVEPDPQLRIFNAQIEEGINQVTLMKVTAVSDVEITEQDMEDMIGKSVTLKILEPVSGSLTASRFDGLIYEFHEPDPFSFKLKENVYNIIVRPKVWKLNIGCNARSFPQKSRIEVIDLILGENRLLVDENYKTSYFKESDYPKLSQILQVEVSDWFFIRQLMEESGINFYFGAPKDGETEETLNILDYNPFFPKGHTENLDTYPPTAMVESRHIASFETQVRTVPESVSAIATLGDGKVREFRAESPLPKGKGGIFHFFSAEGQKESVAKHASKVLSEGFESYRVTYSGKSNQFLLRAGERFVIENQYSGAEKKILVTSVTHNLKQNIQPALAGEGGMEYENIFTAVRHDVDVRPSRHYSAIDSTAGNRFGDHQRMDRQSHHPSHLPIQDVTRIDHLEKSRNSFGIMVGKVIEDTKVSDGKEMTCKVANERFPDGLTAKVSVAWLVPGGGMSALPRKDMFVYFLVVQGAGGQNEAVVVGYRPSSKVGGQDPSKTTKTATLVPGSSPDEAVKKGSVEPNNRQRVGLCGEGGTAEVTILDGDGSVSIHANTDLILVADSGLNTSSATHLHMAGSLSEQLGSVTRIVTGDQTELIGGNHKITVKGNQSAKIKGNQSLEITGNEEKTIKSNRTIKITGTATDKIDGMENKTVKGPRTVTMKAGHVEKITGAESKTVKGVRTMSVSKDYSETVKGQKALSVKKDYSQDIKGKAVTKVKKDAAIVIDGKLSIEVKKKVQIKCGSSKIIIDKSGKVTVKGKKFSHKASSDVKIKGSKINLN